MDYAIAVGVVERERYLGEIDRHIQRELPLPPERVPERFAADERHRVPELAAASPESSAVKIEDAADGRQV